MLKRLDPFIKSQEFPIRYYLERQYQAFLCVYNLCLWLFSFLFLFFVSVLQQFDLRIQRRRFRGLDLSRLQVRHLCLLETV